ncbi:MAG: hypothetical protein QCI38_00880 [Candidatus Thermoplasmatota archaeon]|nr:hypothetical protein [Candidatus Thermoplasmatota archaeon]
MSGKVLVVLACDVDHDRDGFVEGESDSQGLSWRGVEEGLSLFNENLRDVQDSYGNGLKALWFIRSDFQMKKVYGDCAWPFKAHAKILKELASFGDEIGWHVHLWKWHEEKRGWYAETSDALWKEACIREGHGSIPDGWKPFSAKAGWCYQDPLTMRVMSNLGLKADFSCVPDAFNTSFTKEGLPVDVMDWRGSPLEPYHPSRKDPRRAGSDALPIWEVPSAPFKRSAKRIVGTFAKNMLPFQNGKVCLPKIVVKRYGAVTAGGSTINFQKGCEAAFQNAKAGKTVVFSTYFHPDCLLVDKSSGLYENRDNLFENIQKIKDTSSDTGVPFRFVTGKELVAFLEG